MHFEIDFKADHLIRTLSLVRQQLVRPEELLGGIGEALLPITRKRHDQGLAPDGTKWKELSPATLKRKRNPKILYEHGDLLRFHYQVAGDTLYIGTNDKKGVFHHFGTRRTARHPGLPARPLAGFPADDQRLVSDLIGDHLAEALRGARGG